MPAGRLCGGPPRPGTPHWQDVRAPQLLCVTSKNQGKMDKGIFIIEKAIKSLFFVAPWIQTRKGFSFLLSMEISKLKNKSNNQRKNCIDPKEREAKSGLFDVKTTSLIG